MKPTAAVAFGSLGKSSCPSVDPPPPVVAPTPLGSTTAVVYFRSVAEWCLSVNEAGSKWSDVQTYLILG